MRAILKAAATLLAVGIAGMSSASASVMTFGTPGSYASYTEAGMTINPILGSTAVAISGGEWDLPCCNAGSYNFELTTGGLFNLQSVFFSHSDSGDPITFRGFVGATEIVSQVVNGSNVGLVNFSGFAGLDRVTINVAGQFRDPDMDNLTFQASVPEPASMLLFGAGLLGLGAIRRARRA